MSAVDENKVRMYRHATANSGFYHCLCICRTIWFWSVALRTNSVRLDKRKKIKYLTKQCYIWQFHKDTDYYYISLIWGCFLVMKKIMLKVIFLSSGFFFLIFQSLSLIRKHLVISTPTYLDLRFCWWKIHAQDIVQYNNQRHRCIALN